jgi:hypothetical protein
MGPFIKMRGGVEAARRIDLEPHSKDSMRFNTQAGGQVERLQTIKSSATEKGDEKVAPGKENNTNQNMPRAHTRKPRRQQDDFLLVVVYNDEVCGRHDGRGPEAARGPRRGRARAQEAGLDHWW